MEENQCNNKISTQSPSYSILNKLSDIDFRIDLLSFFCGLNPNVDWSLEIRSFINQHKSDDQIIKLLRARSWVDQDIEPECNYSNVFETLHSIFDSILLKHAYGHFNDIKLKEDKSETEIKLRILEVKFNTLPIKLELDLYVWRKCLIDFCAMTNIQYEFVDQDQFEIIEKSNCRNLYRFNLGWPCYETWKIHSNDSNYIEFIWNGIKPSSENAKFFKELLIQINTIPIQNEE